MFPLARKDTFPSPVKANKVEQQAVPFAVGVAGDQSFWTLFPPAIGESHNLPFLSINCRG